MKTGSKVGTSILASYVPGAMARGWLPLANVQESCPLSLLFAEVLRYEGYTLTLLRGTISALYSPRLLSTEIS